MNRLRDEKSPYLLQHADNPVDWRPWGSEAFSAAACENKPIFLSVGYSACHWCHVMAHESFEDAGIAEALNRDFIPVKVDREERPDAAAPYTAAYPCPASGARYYLCRAGACQSPTDSIGQIEEWIGRERTANG